MNNLAVFFLGDPLKSGAQVLSDNQVVEILRGESENLEQISPYAKTIGYVLSPPDEAKPSE